LEIKNILKQYQVKNVTKLYLDKNLDSDGINYENYIGLKFETINNYDIKDKYTINGWYLLWYLMANAHQGQYIETTIDFIATKTNFKHKDIKDLLINLHNLGTVYMVAYTQTGKEKSFKSIMYNESIEIAIGYSNKESYEDYNGYNAIPIEFVKSVLPTLKPTAWALYCVLVVRHSYFLPLDSFVDTETGEIKYPYSITHYAFSTQDQIGECIGVSDTTIKKYTDELKNNKYPLIHFVGDGKRYKEGKEWKRENIKYGVYLLERVEYQYYHTIIPDNKTDKPKRIEERKLINKKGIKSLMGTEEQYIIKQADYINYILGNTIKDFEKALTENNTIWYEGSKDSMKIRL
jgi:biotin operon repressor